MPSADFRSARTDASSGVLAPGLPAGGAGGPTPFCTIVPPYVLEALASSGDPAVERRARATLEHDEALRAGTVWVNCFFIRDLRTPFGGVGDSGVGREGGNFSREFFTEPKAVVMQIKR